MVIYFLILYIYLFINCLLLIKASRLFGKIVMYISFFSFSCLIWLFEGACLPFYKVVILSCCPSFLSFFILVQMLISGLNWDQINSKCMTNKH